MFKIIKKADIILFIILIIAGLGLSYWSVFGSTAGEKVLVSVNGKLYGTYSLNENRTITIKENNHTNKITIKDGKVQMTFSDCKNQVCVKDGSISKTSQSIVCLPNRVSIEISGEKGEYDAISN